MFKLPQYDTICLRITTRNYTNLWMANVRCHDSAKNTHGLFISCSVANLSVVHRRSLVAA